MERYRNHQDFLQRKLKAAKALVQSIHILPDAAGYHSDHFIHEDPENLGYMALRESDDGLDYDWTRYDGNEVVHTPPNRYTDMGEYLDRGDGTPK